MSFTTGRFCGLTMRGFKSQIGWGNQVGQLTVDLVPDVLAGDTPLPPPYGTPVYFKWYGFKFSGLLQKWTRREATDGLPTYEAVVYDPREVLADAEIILGNYSGTVYTVRNLINAYGYWESFGFGQSGVNSAGMPWHKVLAAVNAICNTPAYGPYGGPLTFRGVAYSVDLSQLPVPPGYYRLGGSNINLMDAVDQICSEAGYDYFVDLVGFTIRVRTVPRYYQPPLGVISAMVASAAYSGQVASAEQGVEVRNEATSAFVVGGDRTGLHLTQAIGSFWGYDLEGAPVIATPGPHPGIDGTHDFMTVNAAGVADIIGSTGYLTNTVEIRCAMAEGGYGTWSAYVKKYKPWLQSYVPNIWGKDNTNPIWKPDLLNDSAAAVRQAANTDLYNKTMRLYQFVRSLGENYYGKQYLVQLPFLLSSTDAETAQVTYSQEPTDAGFLPDGAPALGLSVLNQDLFTASDDRILPFVHYPNAFGADTSRVNWAESCVEADQSFYSRVSVDHRIITYQELPCVLVRLSSVLYDAPLDPQGDKAIINKIMADGQPAVEKARKQEAVGSIGELRIHPAARTPTTAAIPLKSNILTYGPWYVAGAPGRVRFEHDHSLTPWDYGGWQAMDQAGWAKVFSGITNMQLSEAAWFEHAAPPAASLGDVLQTGGPNLTGVNVQVSDQGVTTTYRMETFTPRFGQFSKANAERLRRSSLAAVELRRGLRRALAKKAAALMTVDAAFRGWLAHAPRFIKRQSPHDVLIAKSFAGSGTDVRVGVAAETYEYALGLTDPDADDHLDQAVMSLSGLVRPFVSKFGPDNNSSLLPNFNGSGLPELNEEAITASGYNPFAHGHDIEVVTQKDEYEGMHAYERGAEPDNTRAIALRGPLVVSGWGLGVDGKAYPGDDEDPTGDSYAPNVMRRSDLWKTGPVDMLWDDQRGVWTSHDLLYGELTEEIAAPYGSGLMNVGGSEDWQQLVYNFSAHTPVPTGLVIAGYVANKNRYFVIAADCPPAEPEA